MADETDHSIYERLATLETEIRNIREDIKTRENESTWIKRGLFGTLVALVVDLIQRFQGGSQ